MVNKMSFDSALPSTSQPSDNDVERPSATSNPLFMPLDEDTVLLGTEGEKKQERIITVPFTKGRVQLTETQLKKYKKISCLSVTYLTLIGLVLGMILAGSLPEKNPNDVEVVLPPTTRTYYIQAEEIQWTFTPGGKDALLGPLFGTYVNKEADPNMIGGSIIKGVYRAYTDATFTVRVVHDARVHRRT
jgi:hypothetical protein